MPATTTFNTVYLCLESLNQAALYSPGGGLTINAEGSLSRDLLEWKWNPSNAISMALVWVGADIDVGGG